MTTQAKKPRVLVVDDAPEIRAIMQALFECEGFEVVLAVDAEEAVNKFIEDATVGVPFNLISVDIRMPNVDGIQLAKKLRELGHAGPMVAFTANASALGKKTSIESGINAYFNKAVLNRALIQALKDQYCSKF